MKFLCLHGRVSNATTLANILAPLATELQSDGTATFTFAQGTIPDPLAPKFLGPFGAPPHFQYIQREANLEKSFSLGRVCHGVEFQNGDDHMQVYVEHGMRPVDGGVDAALNKLDRFIAENGPFDGVLGFSDGAGMAATLLLREKQKFLETGRPPQLKFAIYFCAIPPVIPGTTRHLAAKDIEKCPDQRIDIPTLHVIGSRDMIMFGSIALYNLCKPDTRVLFDHGKGHTIPGDRETVKALAKKIRRILREHLQ